MAGGKGKAGAYNPLTIRLAVQLANPRSWVASVCPALFGICYCWVRGWPLGAGRAAALLAACVLLQSAVNTFNDYFDFMNGTDRAEDHVEESDSTLIYGGIDPKSALRLAAVFFAAGVGLGALCSIGRGWLPLLIGFAGAMAVLLYSAGPVPFSHLPVGELVSGVEMGGLIPLGIAACADGRLHPGVLLWSLPFILGISLIMMTNNGCDIEKDGRAGRRTLPRMLGRPKTVVLYRVQAALWLILLLLLPVLLLGPAGLTGPVLLALLCRKRFRALLRFRLEPEDRILQIKAIAESNLWGNGAYVAALAAALALGVLHG